MKRYTYTTYKDAGMHGNSTLADKLRLLCKTFLYLILLTIFILVFCGRGCRRAEDGIFGEEKEIITPGGDTLRGQNPILMNPDLPRNGAPADPEDAKSIDWPKTVGGPRNPNLPGEEDNRIPPVNPDDEITDPVTGRRIDGAHLFVVLDSDSNDDTFNRFAEELTGIYSQEDCSIVYYNTLSKTILLQVNKEKRDMIKEQLPLKITDISFFVVEVELLLRDYIPNDPAFSYPDFSWQYEPIQAYDAWDITKGSSDITVAVIDSYFDLNHPDLRNVKTIFPYSMERGTDCVLPSPELRESDPGAFVHGTHVAGIIFGEINNAEGAAGISPSCSFMPISLGTNLNSFAQVEAILYAIYKGADVINLSLGAYFNEDFLKKLTLEDQIELSRNMKVDLEKVWDYIFKLCNDRNVTIVWSAGNQNILSSLDASKRNSSTVRVEALDPNLKKAGYSNFGIIPDSGVDNSTISAPGSRIMSSIPYGDYLFLDGTSMAAPIVTGAVALMKSVNANLTNEEVIDILKSTSKPLSDKSIGGLLQIKSALDRVKEDFLRFNDVLTNPELLVGNWESTENFSVIKGDVRTGEHVKIVLSFQTPDAGQVHYIYLDGERIGEICSAPVSVLFTADEITITDLSNPVSEEGSSFIKSIYHCKPDSEGYLKASQEREEHEDMLKFNLRRIE